MIVSTAMLHVTVVTEVTVVRKKCLPGQKGEENHIRDTLNLSKGWDKFKLK